MNPSVTPHYPDLPAEPWLDVVRQKVAGIRFGSVQITVHEGRVTQIEAVEKTRIEPQRVDSAVGSKLTTS